MSTARRIPSTGLIAILRGLIEADAPEVGRSLYDAGFRTLEVPLNSPEPLRTISTLRTTLPADCLVGAGTVLSVDQVRQCHEAGAQLIVSPNTNADVIRKSLHLGMQSFPGAATPSEAFAAIAAGAEHIKIFPAEQVGIGGLKAWTAVIPKGVGLIPVGGVDAANVGAWLRAGATGVGIGSALFTPGISAFTPGISAEILRQRAASICAAWASALSPTRRSA